MTHYVIFIFLLLQQGAETTSAEMILNISAAVGETAELVCNEEPAHPEELTLAVSWYRCRNAHDCEQLLGAVTPDLKCLTSSLKRLSFTTRTSENSGEALVISDLREDDAGFYKCDIEKDKQILSTQKVHLHIKQKPAKLQLTTTTMDNLGTSSAKLNIPVADVVLISIAVAVWLGVITVMLFLCLYIRHFCLKASSQASVRRPEMFQITQTHNETTAEPLSTVHPLQRVRPDSGPQEEEDAYESLSGGIGDVYNNLEIAARQHELNEEIRRCFRRTELNSDGDTDY